VFDVSVVTGSTKSAVSAARQRINLIVTSARRKQQSTHFLSIPMAGDCIKKNFLAFRVITIYFCVVNIEVQVINLKVQEVIVKLCTKQYCYLFSFSALHSENPRPE
jgi:activating signal cointegrator complex subunit 1